MPILRENLVDKGFEDACRSFGDPDTLKNNVNLIRHRGLVDINSDFNLDEQSRKDQIQTYQHKIDTLNQFIDEKKNEITTLQNKQLLNREYLEKLKLNPLDPTIIISGGTFSWFKYVMLLIIFIGLSMFLFYYYSGIPYESLIKKCDPSTKMFPSYFDWVYGINTQPIIAIIPLVFFAFGISLHFAWQYAVYQRIALLAFLIIITFALDIRMAISIYECISTQHYLSTGETLPLWYNSGLIYVVIMLGFVVFFLWSFLFHTIINETSKLNRINFLRSEVSNILVKIDLLNHSISSYKSKLSILLQKLASVSTGPLITDAEINKCIKLYQSGFYELLNSNSRFNNSKFKCDSYITNSKEVDENQI